MKASGKRSGNLKEPEDKAVHVVVLRLNDASRDALDELTRRWGCTATEVLRSVVVQLARRSDLTSVLDLRYRAGHVDILRSIRKDIDKALKAAEEAA